MTTQKCSCHNEDMRRRRRRRRRRVEENAVASLGVKASKTPPIRPVALPDVTTLHCQREERREGGGGRKREREKREGEKGSKKTTKRASFCAAAGMDLRAQQKNK